MNDSVCVYYSDSLATLEKNYKEEFHSVCYAASYQSPEPSKNEVESLAQML